MKNYKILFISHGATNTGAVNALLDIQEWLKSNTNIDFETLVLGNGPNVARFLKLGKCWLEFPNRSKFKATRLIERIIHKYFRFTFYRLKKRNYSLIYSNTITNGKTLVKLSNINIPVITHVHELETLINSSSSENINAVKKHCDYYFSASDAVKTLLSNDLNIDPEIINTTRTFINISKFSHAVDKSYTKNYLLKELGLDDDCMIVGLCGYGSSIKGTDLIPQIASGISELINNKKVYILHIGKIKDSEKYIIERDLRLLGLTDKVIFLGQKQNAAELISVFDVLALPSREESVSLVMLEAAYYGIPTVCFEKSGGPPIFCADDCGLISPYLDIRSMAQSIQFLLRNDDERLRIGNNAKAKLMREYTAETVMPKWFDSIEAIIEKSKIDD